MWRKAEDSSATPNQSSSAAVREESSPSSSSPAEVVPPKAFPAPAAPREAAPVASHLTGSLLIKGEIAGSEDLFIEGQLQGKIRIQEGRVTIGEKGRVTADIEARDIVICGLVKGKLLGRERLQVGQTGRADGDLLTPRILIEDGAEIHGRVEITRGQAHPPSGGLLNGKSKGVLAAESKDLGGFQQARSKSNIV